MAHSFYKFQKVRQSKTKSVFLIAALTGDIKLIEKIFQGENDKNPMGTRNCTPLHYVAAEGDLLVCKWIIRNVQNKNPKNVIGWTPLHNAAANGHLEVCQLIMENITENKTNKFELYFFILPFFDEYTLKFTLKNKNKEIKKNSNICKYEQVKDMYICIKKGKSTRFLALKI